MMKPRKYTKLIELHDTQNVSDGFGGNIVTSSLKYKIWANTVTKRTTLATDNGDVQNVEYVVFTIRNRYDLNINAKTNYIFYNGFAYNINGITNEDLDSLEVSIKAIQRNGN